MPPLNPPAECFDKMTQRPDDTEEVVLLLGDVQKVDHSVEDYYREQGLLSDFPIMGGIPETTPVLLSTS